MPRVNLIPGDERARGGRRNAMILPVAGAAALALALGGSYFYFDRQLSSTEDEYESYVSRNAGIARQVKELQNYEQLKADKNKVLAGITDIYGQRERWSRTLDDLSFVIPSDVSLITITAIVPGAKTDGASAKTAKTSAAGDMILEGYTDKMDTIATLMVRMGLIPTLTNIVLISAESDDDGETKRIRFQLAASLKSPGSDTAVIAPTTGEDGPADVTPTTPTGTTTSPTGTVSGTGPTGGVAP